MFGNCKFEGGSSERDCECATGTCRSWTICNEKHTCSCGHTTGLTEALKNMMEK
jgi:hypothetical protein